MNVNHIVEKPDGSVVFQGVLEGKELAFVIERGLDALIEAGVVPFVSTKTHAAIDLYDVPEATQ
jgi:hypothetical protein